MCQIRFRYRYPKFRKNVVLDCLAFVITILIFKTVWTFGAIIIPFLLRWDVLIATAAFLLPVYMATAWFYVHKPYNSGIARGWQLKAAREKEINRV